MMLYNVFESKIHGKGVFAREKIPAGTIVVEYRGEKIPKSESPSRIERDANLGISHVFSLNESFDVDGYVDGSDAVYVNHSCNPNLLVNILEERIWFVAARDIHVDEELFIDYNFDAEDPICLNYKCRCGQPNCRGYIVCDEDLPKLKHKLLKSEKRPDSA